MSSTVLVTGPTGKVGRRLIPILTCRGDHQPFRGALIAAGAALEAAEFNSQLHAMAMSTGAFDVLNDDVLKVTGRPPVSFGEFAVGAAAAWRR